MNNKSEDVNVKIIYPKDNQLEKEREKYKEAIEKYIKKYEDKQMEYKVNNESHQES